MHCSTGGRRCPRKSSAPARRTVCARSAPRRARPSSNAPFAKQCTIARSNVSVRIGKRVTSRRALENSSRPRSNTCTYFIRWIVDSIHELHYDTATGQDGAVDSKVSSRRATHEAAQNARNSARATWHNAIRNKRATRAWIWKREESTNYNTIKSMSIIHF